MVLGLLGLGLMMDLVLDCGFIGKKNDMKDNLAMIKNNLTTSIPNLYVVVKRLVQEY